jgi:hypothetical protein
MPLVRALNAEDAEDRRGKPNRFGVDGVIFGAKDVLVVAAPAFSCAPWEEAGLRAPLLAPQEQGSLWVRRAVELRVIHALLQSSASLCVPCVQSSWQEHFTAEDAEGNQLQPQKTNYFGSKGRCSAPRMFIVGSTGLQLRAADPGV